MQLPMALRGSRPALWLQAHVQRLRRARRFRSREGSHGHCPVCDRAVRFANWQDNPRESPLCLHCGSVPRQRALQRVLAASRDLANARVHESSPSLCSFRALRARCAHYAASYYVPGHAPGAPLGVFRNVDLGAQPFPDGAFDAVVTQDVFEHVPDPRRALREISRTLRPGGLHVFTVPVTTGMATRTRAELRDGAMHHLLPPEYHRDPSDPRGSLVVTDFGDDLAAFVQAHGLRCRVEAVQDAQAGIPQPIEVFVASKG
jgi:SAM-dependent methyltransferase